MRNILIGELLGIAYSMKKSAMLDMLDIASSQSSCALACFVYEHEQSIDTYPHLCRLLHQLLG